MTQDSPARKFLKQVGSIVAVQAVAGAATELGKTIWPKIKGRLNSILDKADEINRTKNTREDLRDLVKDTAEHVKEEKRKRATPAESTKAEPESPNSNPTA